MQSIFVKIKKSNNQNGNPIKGAINLSQNNLSDKISFKKWRLFFWLALALVLAEASFIFFLLATKPSLKFQNLIPKDAQAVVYFNQSILGSQTNLEAMIPTRQKIQDLLQKTGLSLDNIRRALDGQMVLILRQDNGQTQWQILTTYKTSSPDFLALLQEAKKNLKQSYDVSTDIYRQIEITQIKPLNQDSSSIFFFSLKNYFILSNDLPSAQKIIDQAFR